MQPISKTRPSAIAGTWYEGQPKRLAESVDSYLERANIEEITGKVIGLVAPHAGHRYSGPVAGYAFAAVRGLSPGLVAVLSPMHHPYPYPLITSAHDFYETPLGKIPVDRPMLEALSQKLEQRLGYGLTPVANDPEHALEIELPFLQRALSAPFSLIPIMLRQQDPTTARILGETLAELLRTEDCLLVASTDLSHFYDQSAARQLDSAMLTAAESFEPDALFEIERSGKGEACGLGALAATLWAAKALGADAVKILNYATSGDASGDYERVVGYGAGVITLSAKP
ncbi:MAG: AmmeMemoRadiSam system protein B [Anaerolineales bacterium]|jgi:AmmeMemoRadiSam system protein B|nr:AmmeMemoRadiSam system protein B [Anaerolineales bacterium]